MQTDVQAKLDRQAAFWKRQNNDRPLVGFTGAHFQGELVRGLKPADGYVTAETIDLDRVVETCDAEYALWRDCMGDLFWSTSPFPDFYGWLCAILGAPLRHLGEVIWAERFLDRYEDLAVDVDSEWRDRLWAVTDALVEHAAGRYPVAPKSVFSPLATLGEVRGITELGFDLHDRPGEVQRAMSVLTDAWARLVQENFEHLPEWHGGYTSAPRRIWAPGRIVEFEEDPVFMFSPDAHRRFIVPSHRELMRRFEYAYIHLHSAQLHTLDNLLELDGLAAIELTPDPPASVLGLIPTIARIRERTPCIVHGYMTAEEMRTVMEQVPPEGLCLIGRVDSPDDALRLQDAVVR